METHLIPIEENAQMNWNSADEIMKTSQFIAQDKEVNTTLEKVTSIVNKQTLKGYRAGYADGFVEGMVVGNITGILYGISASLIVTGIIMFARSSK